MSRIVQKRALRGSQKWLQLCASEFPLVLSEPVARSISVVPVSVTWLSPIESDDFAEYRDSDFLEKLGVSLNTRSLLEFWPKGGPVWDGLGRTENGDLLLVEAKAHIGEIKSSASQASPASLERIQTALRETQHYLGVDQTIDWSGRYYQYTNRLAHLYFLREVHQLPAWLVFVYFVNDTDMSGPGTKEEWGDAIKDMKSALGLPENHLLSEYVIDLYVDVNGLPTDPPLVLRKATQKEHF